MDYNTAINMAAGTSSTINIPVPAEEDYQPKRAKSRHGSKQPSIEKLYAKLTAEGIACKIVRKKGQAPRLVLING